MIEFKKWQAGYEVVLNNKTVGLVQKSENVWVGLVKGKEAIIGKTRKEVAQKMTKVF